MKCINIGTASVVTTVNKPKHFTQLLCTTPRKRQSYPSSQGSRESTTKEKIFWKGDFKKTEETDFIISPHNIPENLHTIAVQVSSRTVTCLTDLLRERYLSWIIFTRLSKCRLEDSSVPCSSARASLKPLPSDLHTSINLIAVA